MGNVFRTGFGRVIALRMLSQTGTLKRVTGDAYEQVSDEDIACSIYSAGVDNSRLKNVAPELRSHATGTIAVAYSTAILAKDRVIVSDRTFEIIAPISPDENEWLHRAVIREIQPFERVLYLCLRPEGHDGASSSEPLPELVKVLPFAFIVDKGVEAVAEKESGGMEAVNLKQVEASEIARSYLSSENLERLLYCLLVPSDVEVAAEDAQARVYPRFRFNGSPSLDTYAWARDYPWSVTLVEER